MLSRALILSALLWCLAPVMTAAQVSVEKILPLDAHFNADGTLLELNWFDAQPPRVGSVTVKRRRYGQIGGDTWKILATGLGPVMRYTDTTVRPGVAYEYQVLRTARDIVDVGYWLGGTEVPAQARRGTVYVIVDDTVAPDIAARLDRFEGDLIAEGWKVRRHPVPRDVGDPVETLKAALALRGWLRDRYRDDPFGAHTAVLVGRVPLLKSGRVNPDGHEPIPHTTDLFYADVDGRWNATRAGEVLDRRLPGDAIELQIGRIDFSTVSADRDAEIRFLRAYFDKNHHWRKGYHGDLREAYGSVDYLSVEQAALRNIVGAGNVTVGGHHDVGEEKPWLWGVDFGDWNGGNYFSEHKNRAVFTINFGSNKQKIGLPGNGMTAMLAQPWYTVSVGWGSRPAWWLHHMALGGSIGLTHLRTVNNGRAAEPYRTSMDYYPTGDFLWRNPIWVNLLGDPTLGAFPLPPVQGFGARSAHGGVDLTWEPPAAPQVQGYRLFRIDPATGSVTDLNGPEPVAEAGFTDDTPDPAQPLYMVRAYGLQKVYAGSFYTYAPGAVVQVDAAGGGAFAADIDVTTTVGQPVVLPDVFSAPQDGVIHAFIEGAPHGQLAFEEGNWVYTPRTGFTGTVGLRMTVSDKWRSAEAALRITVTP